MKKLAGFTLIEAILCVALIMAGVLGILNIYKDAVVESLVADQTVIASNLAREAMEKIIAQRDCNETGCGYTATLTSINAGTYTQNPITGFTGYKLVTTVLEVNNDDDNAVDDFLDAKSGSGYARITITVSFNTQDNVKLVTLLANY